MKIWSIPCILCWSMVPLAGCEETLSPKEPYHDRYLLHAFIEGSVNESPTTMDALVARTYDVDGFDPSVNSTDPSIGGAVVVLSRDIRQDTLKERYRVTNDSLRYGPNQRYYSATIKAPYPGDLVTLSARLPNGSELTAQTIVPLLQLIQPAYVFPRNLITRPEYISGIEAWVVNWTGDVSSHDHLFFPRLRIRYWHGGIISSVFVPMTIVNGEAIYPSYTNDRSCSFDFVAIDTALARLSAGDPQKSTYYIQNAIFELLEYDDALSRYYSSTNGAMDPYSIRTTNPVYSNIGGGIGIFGSSLVNVATFDLDPKLVTPFGYQHR
jgi:hypothetical protein